MYILCLFIGYRYLGMNLLKIVMNIVPFINLEVT